MVQSPSQQTHLCGLEHDSDLFWSDNIWEDLIELPGPSRSRDNTEAQTQDYSFEWDMEREPTTLQMHENGTFSPPTQVTNPSIVNPNTKETSKIHLPKTKLLETNKEEAPLKCTWQGCSDTRNFLRKSDYKKHMDKHTRPYVCRHEACNGIKFGDKGGLHRHEREKHGSMKLFCFVKSCPRNSKGFSRQKHLDSHMQTRHKSQPNYDCRSEVDSTMGSTDSPNSVGDGEGLEACGGVQIGEMEVSDYWSRMRGKLEGFEREKADLASRQERLDHNIRILKEAMQLVSV